MSAFAFSLKNIKIELLSYANSKFLYIYFYKVLVLFSNFVLTSVEISICLKSSAWKSLWFFESCQIIDVFERLGMLVWEVAFV